jgi:hypothetical protein
MARNVAKKNQPPFVPPLDTGNDNGNPLTPEMHPSRREQRHRGDWEPRGTHAQGLITDQNEDNARMKVLGVDRERGTLKAFPQDNASRLRPQPVGDMSSRRRQDEGLSSIMADVAQSRIPTQHLSRDRGDITLRNEGMARAGGYYSPAGKREAAPVVGVETDPFRSTHDTVVHELGHARHYDTTVPSERDHPSKQFRDQRGYSPEPLKEAIADGYVDRYGGPRSPTVQEDKASRAAGKPFGHIQSTGYSSHYEDPALNNTQRPAWDNADRAAYTASRAHYSETGEAPIYQRAHPVRGLGRTYDQMDPSYMGATNAHTDALVHHLRTTSAHAQTALENNTTSASPTDSRSLDLIGKQASRRHMDRELLHGGQFVQGSLLNDLRSDSGEHMKFVTNPDAVVAGPDVGWDKREASLKEMDGGGWPHSMEHNQYGEAPRKGDDVRRTLGVGMTKDSGNSNIGGLGGRKDFLPRSGEPVKGDNPMTRLPGSPLLKKYPE